MGRGKELDSEERQSIERLLKDGMTLREISRYLGRSYNTIGTEMAKNGGRKNYKAQNAQQLADITREKRMEKLRRPLSENEVKMIQECLKKDYSMNRIRQTVGVTYFKLRKYLDENELSIKRRSYVEFSQRIELLEQQLEIMLSIIEKGNK